MFTCQNSNANQQNKQHIKTHRSCLSLFPFKLFHQPSHVLTFSLFFISCRKSSLFGYHPCYAPFTQHLISLSHYGKKDWVFLFDYMKKLGIPNVFISMKRNLFHGAKAKLNINGKFSQEFVIKRRVR
jgi:hypothetical protein